MATGEASEANRDLNLRLQPARRWAGPYLQVLGLREVGSTRSGAGPAAIRPPVVSETGGRERVPSLSGTDSDPRHVLVRGRVEAGPEAGGGFPLLSLGSWQRLPAAQ